MIAFVLGIRGTKDLANDLAYSLVIDIINNIASVLIRKLFVCRRCGILAATATATGIGPAVVNFVDSA
jgi:hypothetical protein